MQFTKLVLALAFGSVLSGCATPVFTTAQSQSKTAERVDRAVGDFATQAKLPSSVRVVDEPSVGFTKRPLAARRGDVTIKAANAPMGPLLSDLARKSGYSIVFAENVDATRKVTVEFNQAFAEEAIRTTTFMSGYVAVFNKDRKLITVAETATFTYKVPKGLLDAMKATYKVGSTGSGTSSSSSGGKGSAPASPVNASFGIEGSEGPNGDAIAKLIGDMAGPNAQVTVSATGYVTVRASAQSLARVTSLIKQLSTDALRQVDIEASVIEVELTRDFSYGITWDKVIQRANGSPLTLATAAGDILAGSLTVSRTNASSSALIQALEQFTDVRVVSQPRLVSMNNNPSSFVEATQVPYLGSISQTPSTVIGGAPTVSGDLSFALDGITFSAVPSVIDGNQVQISLLPVLDSVGEFQTFKLGDSQLTAPKSGKKQSFMRVIAENGRTLILGGIRTGSDSTTTKAPSSTAGKRGTKEVVILLRANIIEPKAYDPVVAEAI